MELATLGHPWLLDDFRALSKNAGFTKIPLIYIDRKRDTLAEASKWGGDYTVVLNEKFLKANDREKMRGIIGHELAHIKLGHSESATAPISVREDELAADRLGALIAGNINGLTEYLRASLMDMKSGLGPFGFFMKLPPARPFLYGGYPTHQERIDDLQRLAVERSAELQAGKENLDRLLARELRSEFAQISLRLAAKNATAPVRTFRPAPWHGK